MKLSTYRLSALALALGMTTATMALADVTSTPSTPGDDGVTTPTQNRGQMGPQTGPADMGMKQHRNQMQRRMGPAGEHPELVSEQERIEFRNRMRSAESMEERQALRQEMRTKVQERARAAGIELPEHGRMGMMRGQRPDHAGMGMRGQRPERAGMGMRGERPDHGMAGERGPRH